MRLNLKSCGQGRTEIAVLDRFAEALQGIRTLL